MQQAIGDVCLPSRTWNSCINLVLLLWVTTRRLECKQAAVLAQVAFSVKLTPIFFFPRWKQQECPRCRGKHNCCNGLNERNELFSPIPSALKELKNPEEMVKCPRSDICPML